MSIKYKIDFGDDKKSVLNFIKRTLFYFPWQLRPKFYYHLFNLIFQPSFKKKRILGIWDYKALPWSVGDPLVFIEMLSILKIRHNAEEIDICIVYDRENPGGNRMEPIINKANAQDKILDYLPIFSTSPFLGSIFLFNSRNEFRAFLINNIWRYDIYPALHDHLSEKYNYVGSAPEIIDVKRFYNENGYIPFLKINEYREKWANQFYLNYLPENILPVALSLRGSKIACKRNANPSVWLEFIDTCKIIYPEIFFVIIGTREEVFDGLRDRPNVVIAKDFGTSIIEDFALIRKSFLYMGTTSGIGTIALFSDLPYLVFQIPRESLDRYGMKTADDFPFFKNSQKYFSSETPVTVNLLLNEFKILYSQLDRELWLKDLTKNSFTNEA